jgi:plastocyanin
LHHQIEAIWTYRGIGATNIPLLKKLLNAPDLHARAAATQQLRYWHPQAAEPRTSGDGGVKERRFETAGDTTEQPAASLPGAEGAPPARTAVANRRSLILPAPSTAAGLDNALDLLRERANDESGLVRLEAAIAASYFQSRDAAEVALDLLKHPMDSYLTFALRSALDSLRPAWELDARFATDARLAKFLADSSPKRRTPTGMVANDPFDKLRPRIIRMSTVHERMQFTIATFKVKVGEPVKLILENPDATPHNLLIVKPGSEDEIGQAANQMATVPGAFEKFDFVPKSEKILQATKMLKQGETDTLRFHAPKEPGKYPYICSFPGHYLVMRGTMIVETAK